MKEDGLQIHMHTVRWQCSAGDTNECVFLFQLLQSLLDAAKQSNMLTSTDTLSTFYYSDDVTDRQTDSCNLQFAKYDLFKPSIRSDTVDVPSDWPGSFYSKQTLRQIIT